MPNPPVTPKGVRYGGRQKGTPNKVPATLQQMIMRSLLGPRGGQKYIDGLDSKEFNILLGKILPRVTKIGSGEDGDGPVIIQVITGVPQGPPQPKEN